VAKAESYKLNHRGAGIGLDVEKTNAIQSAVRFECACARTGRMRGIHHRRAL
jgi:hypothetical protein